MPERKLSTPAGKVVATKTSRNFKLNMLESILGGAVGGTAVGLVAAFMITHDPGQHEPGERLADGTIYAGSGLYTTPADMPGHTNWSEAMNYCDNLVANGHNDWRLQISEELNVIFTNHAAIGGFDLSGSFPSGWYWSSSEFSNLSARSQRFSDGDQGSFSMVNNGFAVRCVR